MSSDLAADLAADRRPSDRGRRTGRTTSRRSAPTSRSSRRLRSTTTCRWSTSTAPPRARSRGRARRRARLQRAAQRQRPPRHPHARRRGDRAVRGRPRQGRGVPRRRPIRREIVFTKNATEGLNLLAHSIGAACGRATRSSSPRWSTTPTSCRGSWPASARARRCAGSASPRTAGSTSRPPMPRGSSTSAPRSSRSSTSPTSSAPSTRSPRSSARARAVGAITILDGAQSVPHGLVGVSSPRGRHRRAGPDRRRARRRLPRLHRPQDARPDRHRRALGTLRPARRAAAVPRRRRDGRRRHDGRTTYAAPPHRFEAGTPPIAQAVGLGAAVDYLIGARHRPDRRATSTRSPPTRWSRLAEVPGLRVIGPATAEGRGAAISFALKGIHPHDIGQLLDERGIAVRVGQHCARPVCLRYGVPATTRLSAHVYTTHGEVDALVEGLQTVQRFFSK